MPPADAAATDALRLGALGKFHKACCRVQRVNYCSVIRLVCVIQRVNLGVAAPVANLELLIIDTRAEVRVGRRNLPEGPLAPHVDGVQRAKHGRVHLRLRLQFLPAIEALEVAHQDHVRRSGRGIDRRVGQPEVRRGHRNADVEPSMRNVHLDPDG